MKYNKAQEAIDKTQSLTSKVKERMKVLVYNPSQCKNLNIAVDKLAVGVFLK